MVSPKRIDLSLLDEELRGLIAASSKIFPVSYSYVSDGTNPNGYEYVRVTDTSHKNEVYIWSGVWSLIGADDLNIDWLDVKNVPSAFPPSAHAHVIADVDGLESALDGKVDAVAGKGLTTVDFTTSDKTKLDSLTNNATVDYETMQTDLSTHKNDATVHVTQTEKDNWNTKADASTLSGHTGNTTVHVTQTDKDNWNGKSSITVDAAQPTTDVWYKVVG